MTAPKYIIAEIEASDPDESLFWNNNDGWGDKDSATRFTEGESRKLNAPINGQWQQMRRRK